MKKAIDKFVRHSFETSLNPLPLVISSYVFCELGVFLTYPGQSMETATMLHFVPGEP